MTSRAALLKATLILPVLVVGLVSFVLIRVDQGAGDTLVVAQHQAEALTPASVDRVVRAAPDPIGREKATAASCTPLGSGELHNPWRCRLRYPTGRRIQYRVTVNADGTYVGNDELILAPGPRRRDTGRITGCCIVVP